MLFESSELLYKISFEYNGEKLTFADKHVREAIGQVLDWLYKNKYDFKGPLHQSFGKKLLDLSDIESSPSADYYLRRMRQFYKLKGVDKYFQVVNKEPAFETIKQMLVKFGINESTISSEGFENKTISKIKKFGELETDTDQLEDELQDELQDELEDVYEETPVRVKTRYEFWSYFLTIINDSTDKFKNRTRGSETWLSAPTGINGVSYACVITSKYARIDFGFYKEKSENKKIFDLLYSQKNKIEKEFGKELSWERKDDKRGSVISYKLSPIDSYDKSNWKAILAFFITYFPKFEKTFDPYISEISNILSSSEIKKVSDFVEKPIENPVINPFRQSICILGKSGKGKSTTIDKMLDKMKNTEFEFIIPTSSTTALLSQYSPSLNKYIPSRLGKMIMSAYKNEGTYYIAVIDECHKSNVIEMINDELLQCISTYRNDRNRFISVDDETAELYKGLSLYRGNLIVPDNFGFIFLSSKPEVIIQNSDFFNRVDIYVMVEQPLKDADLSLYIDEDKVELPSKYFTKISGKLEADINRIKELNDD